MDRLIDSGIETLNAAGRWFCSYAWNVSVQVSILIIVLLVLDVLLRRRVRAVVRYAMWMLVFVKLLLPPTLSLPTGIGYYRPEHRVVSQEQTESVTESSAPMADVQPVRQEPVVASSPVTAAVERPTADVPRAHIVPAPAAPAIVRPAVTWRGLVFLTWLSGVLVLSVYLLRRVQYVRMLVGQSIPASDGLTDVLRECGTRLGLRSCPPLRLSDDAPGPAVCGLLRPVVLMPTSLPQTLSEERLRAVLVHELAHIRRADLWANFIQTLLLVAYFFHPLLWLAHAVVRRLREQAVDETVLVALDAEAKSYSTTLIDLAEMTFHRPALGLRLIGIAESRKALEGRIRHMITRPKPRTAKLGLCGLLAIAVAAAALLPMARGETETRKQRFVARLPSGVTVELLGVCNWPDGEPVCWQADGLPLDPPLQAKKSHVGPAADRYGFMLRVTGPDDRNMSWNKIEGADGWEGSCDVVTSDGKRLDDGTAAVANMNVGLEQTNLRVGFATGPWTTISTHDGKRMSTGGGRGVLWSNAFNDSGTTCIVATAEWLKDRTERIIAIDKNGATHTTPQGSVAMSNMDQMTARFYNLRPDQIQEFQYQVRPYDWVEFENVSLRPGHKTGVIVEPKATDAGLPELDRDYSRVQLSALGRTLLICANDRDETFPDTLAEVQDEIDQTSDLSLSWVQENVAYLGRGVRFSNEPDSPIAYDKTLYERGGGTNVLYLDSHVAFERPERLKELGIGPDKPSPAVLRDSVRRLQLLGKNLLIYANHHDDTFPDALEILQSGRTPDDARDRIYQELVRIYGERYAGRMGFEWDMGASELAWYREHVQYLGKGVKATDNPARVLAYDKILSVEGKGTNVLYVDARVEFVSPEEFKELGVVTTRESLPDIFIFSPSHAGFDVFDAINSRTRDWTWNKTGRYHDKEAYDHIFDGTNHRTSHDILVLVFTLESKDRIPAGYEDLLPMPWDQIERRLRQGQTVELSKEARGLHVILLAAPDSDQLKRLVAQSRLVLDSKNIAQSAVTGCDVAIEDFKVHADPDLGTYGATVSIRNRGVATCPKIVVYFYRGDPEIANPMTHGAGPIAPGKTWNECSSQFALREGFNEVRVVLDPADLVQELDETNNQATLTVLVRDGRIARMVRHVVREDHMPKPSIPPAAQSVSLEARVESATRLSDLGKAVLIYANDHDDQLPDELTDIRPEYGVGFSWLYDNVAYLGQGVTVANNPKRPIAYDKMLIQSGAGTNVLYLDTQVVFESPARLEELRIRYEPKPRSAEEVQREAERQARVTVLSHLKQLALAAILYADEHENTPANDLAELEPYIGDDTLLTWAKENAQYVGKGAVRGAGNEAFKTPLFYWKNPPATMNGTAMAFWDGHAEIVNQSRLDDLGITIQR